VAEGERMAVLKYMVLLHRDVPRAAQFYSHGLGLAVNVCTKRWAELQSGPCKIALMEAPRFFLKPPSLVCNCSFYSGRCSCCEFRL
jgi:hypothetical protein